MAFAGHLAPVPGTPAIDPHRVDPLGRTHRIVEVGHVAHRGRVEQDQVGVRAFADRAAVALAANDPAALENAKARYLGKAGLRTAQLKALGTLAPDARRVVTLVGGGRSDGGSAAQKGACCAASSAACSSLACTAAS